MHGRWLLLPALAIAAAVGAQDMTPPRVVPTDKLAEYWAITNTSVDVDMPNSGVNLDKPGCATVSFVIEKDGSTSTIRVHRVVPPGDLGRVAASEAASLHFAPTMANAGRSRVMSWLIFPFNLPQDPEARKAVMQKCYIKSLDLTGK